MESLESQGLSAAQVNDVLGIGALGFGLAGIVAPTTLRRTYGMTASSGELTYFGRMWGTRTAVIGALALMADTKQDRQRVATLAFGMNAVDALVAATTRELPRRTRVMGSLTSGFFAVAAAYGATIE